MRTPMSSGQGVTPASQPRFCGVLGAAFGNIRSRDRRRPSVRHAGPPCGRGYKRRSTYADGLGDLIVGARCANITTRGLGAAYAGEGPIAP